MPSDLRQFILIDGEPTHEFDWPQFHPQLLYAMASVELDGAAYEIPGFTREQTKLAFQVLINARSKHDALAALRMHLGFYRGVGEDVRSLYEAVCARHGPIAQFFATGAGLQLQRIDGDLVLRVHARLLRHGIPAISVHDSVIVAERNRQTRNQIMEDELDALLRRLRDTSGRTLGKTKPSPKNVPQKGPVSLLSARSSLPYSTPPK